MRAARHGLPLTLAIIGGDPRRFRPFVDLYLQRPRAARPTGAADRGAFAGARGGVGRARPATSCGRTIRRLINRIGRERGWPPATRAQFDREAGPEGSLYVGAPETVAAKVVRTVRALGLSRFDLKYSAGTLPHSLLMKSIELIGTQVAPRVKATLGAD